IVVEWGWLDRIRATQLYIYGLPSVSFECLDAGAGYFISQMTVIPNNVVAVTDILSELKKHEVELRFMTDLWPLHDAVAQSSLEFSMIRMRNAMHAPIY